MTPSKSLDQAISDFGAVASKKLGNRAASGEPEDQLRAPLEALLHDVAALCGFTPGAVVAVGESSLSDLKTRPDYAVTVQGALVGFIEVKAPGKGADPRRFRDRHDKEQWAKLQSIPNLLYTDGNEFSLWRSGDLVGAIVRLEGDVASAGAALAGDHGLLALAEDFLRWEPIAPRTAKQLAELTARLCRLLRDEVTEQMERGSPALTSLATDWRRLLFPEASDRHFADGYAQAVTFGLLVARAHELPLASGLDVVAKKLGATDSLIGTALRLLTDSAENQRTLQTSLGTLVRVLDVVQWSKISKGDADAWLYFYENFLEIYDNTLRKQTGSYYTPPPVVESMVRLVNEGLRTRFGLARRLAAPSVTIADPAAGTGTYLLGVLRQVAREVERVDGAGAVPAAVADAVKRLIAFELQLGPYAVAQLRIVAELAELTGQVPHELLHIVCDRHARKSVGRGGEPRRDLPADRRVAAAGEPHQARGVDHRRDREPAVQGEGEGQGRLGGVGRKESPGTPERLDAAGGLEGQRAREASAEPLRLLLALGDVEGVRRRCRCVGEARHRQLQHRRGVPQRPRLPAHARLSAPERRRDLGDRLLSRGASARGEFSDLRRGATTGLHRDGVTISGSRCCGAGDGAVSGAPRGAPAGEVQGARGAHARWCGVAGVRH